ncbi:hypothetical protein N7448_007816 [Penicillium atrosanguineum]|uniref:Xylanolytic transcriptional activator regulatory domain-containing protein n=1 Tax=Penicillium atrosanguineum TaxID=1132637 RepID=A0A9W9UCG1_9EURO|nr:Pyruvate/Phosphoenolpyruvate kinase [Penicillium atrosanguineum]KAJ5127037.1 hypothetical protein N7448_007816 [Penicillium atrosanguineum]KAJ5147242.1 hypothetical protein N7526_000594 [Penicillium atrosanguineum]KAJ5314279.1 Pyruvate/Phosphoenolpyruvate kinase [Penicillium atrosanguineum]KAJ5331446.1 hypothetical protein N7476_001229 [Penicillium atrosanguineum]
MVGEICPMPPSPGAVLSILSYVSTLKRKRDDLDDQLQRQRASRYRQGLQHESGSSGQEATEHTVQAAMGEIGFLSRSAMAEPRDETSGFSEELAMGRMVRAALALSGAIPTQSSIDTHGQKIAEMNDPTIHLRRKLAVPFFTSFLETMGSQFIHIDSKDLWRDFDSTFKDSDDTVGSNAPKFAAKAFVVYMSVATGILLSRESGSLQGLAGGLHRKATKLLPRIMGSGNRIEILHCMLSLVLYSMQSPQGGSTWHLVGLAMKKAIAFRFHNDPDLSVSISSNVLMMRRNTFWSLYIVDRTISTIMDRPFNIEDDEITVQSPEEYMHDSPHMNNALARHSITHARLMSGIRDRASNSVLFHYSNFCYWRDFFRGIASASKFTRGAYMQLSSRAIVEILKSNGSTNVAASMIHSFQTIERDIVTTCSDYIEHEYQGSDCGEFTGGFVEAYDIFAAGAVIVCLTGRSTTPFADANIINKCTALLTTVGERFVGLRVFRRVLWDLSDAVSGNAKSDSIIHELPPMIPDGIRDLIFEKLQRNTVMANH